MVQSSVCSALKASPASAIAASYANRGRWLSPTSQATITATAVSPFGSSSISKVACEAVISNGSGAKLNPRLSCYLIEAFVPQHQQILPQHVRQHSPLPLTLFSAYLEDIRKVGLKPDRQTSSSRATNCSWTVGSVR
jgi:hypothetical protein